MAKRTDNFIWIPSRKSRRFGVASAVLGAALIGIMYGTASYTPLRVLVDGINRNGIGAEFKRISGQRIEPQPTLTDRTALKDSRFETRESADPVLMLRLHVQALMSAKTHKGPVRRLQAKLGVEADGEYDAKTQKALKAWQRHNGLAADGIAGPDTLMAMGFHDLMLLKQGAHGDAVKILQEQLGITADGLFGPLTEKAVCIYQQKNGLVADGIAGPARVAPCNAPAQ